MRRVLTSRVGAWLFFGLCGVAEAELDLGRILEQPASLGDSGARLLPFARRSDARIPVVVSGHTRLTTLPKGLRPLASGALGGAVSPDQLSALVAAEPGLRVLWTPPKRPLLDRAIPQVRADLARNERGLAGAGVVVGLVDTGVDITHGDLRNADGSTRLAWLLDLSAQPTGVHAELEERFLCTAPDGGCAVYSATELDALLTDETSGNEPSDPYGHGTHVLSLAAGNGLASATPSFVGVAPEATIVAVRATRDDGGGVDDPDIISAVEFIFDRAEELGLPAVVNLSLGGDFGAHDGTSELERALSALVGDEYPGRAIVVAGGNSGSLYTGLEPFPDPIGIHSVVHVPPKTTVRIPILIGASALPSETSRVYLWIASQPGDLFEIALETDDSDWIDYLGPGGQREAVERDDATAYLYNGITESDDPSSVDHQGAALLLEGRFTTERVVWLKLRGRATASLWVQGDLGLDPAYGGMGVLLSGAQREGTVTIPATAPELITVGATLNRLTWTDVTGTEQSLAQDLVFGEPGELMSFSSAGPNAVHDLKPNILAPGGFVAGALSGPVDPRAESGAEGMFADPGYCSISDVGCLLVDDTHGLSLGTSMASPIVAGAVALLLEQQPELTQGEIRTALEAGASKTVSPYASYAQSGAGLLDVEGTLNILDEGQSGTEPSLSESWLSLSKAFAQPDSDWPIEGMLHLRDAQNLPVDLERDRLAITVDNGTVVEELERAALGFYRFAVSANDRSGTRQLAIEVRLDGEPWLRTTLEIAVDAATFRGGAVASRGCALGPSGGATPSGRMMLLLGVAALLARRRASALPSRR